MFIINYDIDIILQAVLTAAISFLIAYFTFKAEKKKDKIKQFENDKRDSRLFFMKLRAMLELVKFGLVKFTNTINVHKERFVFIKEGKHLSSIKLSEYDDYYDERVLGYAIYNRDGSEEELFQTYNKLVVELKELNEKIDKVESHYIDYVKGSKRVWKDVELAYNEFESRLITYSNKEELIKNGCSLYKDLNNYYRNNFVIGGIGTTFRYKYSKVQEENITPIIEITERERADNEGQPNFTFYMDMLKKKNKLNLAYTLFEEGNKLEIEVLESELKDIHNVKEKILKLIYDIEKVPFKN